MTPSPAPEEAPDPEVVDAVLSYLRTHPEAADTLQGITRWWLPRQRYERELERIEGVLKVLAARGALQVHALPDGTALYALGTVDPGDTSPDPR